MITMALVVAGVTLAGFMILFYKLPVWLRRFLSKRYIILDILLCMLAFWVLSFTLVGIMAAAFISLAVSAYLLWYKKTAPTPKRPIIDRPRKSYNCRTHVHLAARCYSWWKQRRA